MAIVERDNQYINDSTGQIYDPKDWIINAWSNRITVVKRLSEAQLTFIQTLEYQLGYKPTNHSNMPAFKAVKLISKLQERVAERKNQGSLFS